MTIGFACALSHAPGIVAWREAAPVEQRDRIYSGFDVLRERLAGAELDSLIVFTAEHWVNFFLDHISAFCVGRAEEYPGPIEPWLKIEKARVKGDPRLADELIQACYEDDVEPGYAYEMAFDHGTMIPLHFLTPKMDLPVVPIMINTLAAPQPSVRRCMKLGRIVGKVARTSKRRIGLIATGGMSHDPGERNHGRIDESFDREFLDAMKQGDPHLLQHYTVADLAAAGAGTIELLSWIALAAALERSTGEIIAYEPIEKWASGVGMMSFSAFQPA